MFKFPLHEKIAKHTYEAKCGRTKLRRCLEHETLAESLGSRVQVRNFFEFYEVHFCLIKQNRDYSYYMV